MNGTTPLVEISMGIDAFASEWLHCDRISSYIAGMVSHSIGRGVSQSGNFLRGWLHLGFNQDETGRQVHDGLWPIIAGRRIALNFRWAQPDGVLELYQAGSEGPQWWVPHPDPVRGLPARSILDRCERTRTCPKIDMLLRSTFQSSGT